MVMGCCGLHANQSVWAALDKARKGAPCFVLLYSTGPSTSSSLPRVPIFRLGAFHKGYGINMRRDWA